MPRFSKTIAAGLLILGAGFASAGCVDNESSMYIIGVFQLEASQCLASPDSSAVLRPVGVLDRLFSPGYQAAFLVGSQLTERGSREKLRTETSRVQVQGADVTLYGTDGGTVTFSAPATGLIDAASGTDPGLAAVFAQIVRTEDFAVLGPPGQAIARIRVFGTTLGGQDIESGNFDYPIYVCDGCLISYPVDAADPSAPPGVYLCSGAADTMQSSSEITACFPGQDATIPCTSCAAFSDICQDPSLNPAFQSN